MSGKVSSVDVAIASYKRLAVRPKSVLPFFALLFVLYLVEAIIPPDPFIWLIYGLPLLIVTIPIQLLVLHLFLSTREENPRVMPDGMLRKCMIFFGWSILFSALLQPTLLIFFVGFIMKMFGGVSFSNSVSSLAIQVVNLLFLLLLVSFAVVGAWVVATRALVFACIVTDSRQPFHDAGRLVKGNSVKYLLSFLLMYLPFILSASLLIYLTKDGGLLADAGYVVDVAYVLLDTAGAFLLFSGLSVWYERLSVRSNDATAAVNELTHSSNTA